MKPLVAFALAVTGIIHLIPILGVSGPSALTRLYGVVVVDPGVSLLLQHRAVLFGVLGVGFIVAAFRSAWHGVGLAVAILSTASFVALGLASPDRTPEIQRVLLVDVALVVLLVVASTMHVLKRERHT